MYLIKALVWNDNVIVAAAMLMDLHGAVWNLLPESLIYWKGSNMQSSRAVTPSDKNEIPKPDPP